MAGFALFAGLNETIVRDCSQFNAETTSRVEVLFGFLIFVSKRTHQPCKEVEWAHPRKEFAIWKGKTAVHTLNFVSFLSRSMGLRRTHPEKNDLTANRRWGRLSGERGNERQEARATWRSGADASEASDWSRASVAIPSYRRGEKRRSSRVTLAVPIRVDGENIAGEKFIVSTVTVALSQFGCLIQLDEDILVDQTIVLMNEHTRQSAQCRIVSTRRQRNGHKHVGVEFISPSENFWRLTFVKPGAKSLKRIYGTPES